MTNEILKMDSTTGWTVSSGSSIVGLSQEHIANNNTASSIFQLGSSVGEYLLYTPVAPISAVGYDQLTLHIEGKNNLRQDYSKPEHFSYSIELGTGKVFYLKVFETFCDVSIDLVGITSIEKIKITKLVSGIDFLNISSINLYKQELPLDIFVGLQKQIQFEIAKRSKILLATMDTVAGASSISFAADTPYIDRYAGIEITDGTNTEIHQIGIKSGLSVQFTGLYDNSTLKYDMTAANVYLYFPVEFGVKQKEAVIPSITVWNMEPEVLHLTSELNKVIDTFKSDGTFLERTEGLYETYSIFIDCQARQDSILALLSEYVRRTIGGKYIWVGGKKIFIKFDGKPTETPPIDHFDIIPKIEYRCTVEIKEDIFDDVLLPATSAIVVETNIQ